MFLPSCPKIAAQALASMILLPFFKKSILPLSLPYKVSHTYMTYSDNPKETVSLKDSFIVLEKSILPKVTVTGSRH